MRTPKLNNFLVNQRQASPLTERGQKAMGVKASPFRPLTPADSYRHFIKQRVNPVVGDQAPPVKMNGGGEMVGTKDDRTPNNYADGGDVGQLQDPGKSVAGGVRGVIGDQSAAEQAKKSLADSMNNPNANAMNTLTNLYNKLLGNPSPGASPTPVQNYGMGGVAEYGANDRDELHTSQSGHMIHAAHGAVIEAEPDDDEGMTIHARKMTPKEEDQTKDAAIAALKHILGSLESSDDDSDEDDERPSKGKKK